MGLRSVLIRPLFAALLASTSTFAIAQTAPPTIELLPQIGIEALGEQAATGNAGAAFAAGKLLAGEDMSDAQHVMAVDYLQQASDAGMMTATLELANLLRRGISGVPADLPRAAALFEKAVAAGNYLGMSGLAGLLRRGGDGLEKDVERAEQLMAAASDYLAPSGKSTDEEVLALAEAGNGPAMLLLGKRLSVRDRSEAEHATGVEWLEKASEAGFAAADVSLGNIYRSGIAGVEADPALAMRHYEIGAEAGDAVAQVALAGMLLASRNGTPDPARAVQLLQAAVESGEIGAMTTLAGLYADGKGVPVDGEKAEGLYLAGLAAGSPRKAAEGLADLYREGVAGFAADPGMAAEYYAIAEALGSSKAPRELAEMQLAGEGMPADPQAAIAKLESLAADNPNLLVELGKYFAEGKLIAPDGPRALGYFEAALDEDVAGALSRMASLYAKGAAGLEADPVRAYGYYAEAALAGDAGAARIVAGMLARGEGVTADVELAASQYEALGDPASMLLAGDMFSQGLVTAADPARAIAYYKKAAEAGSASAYVRLADLYRKGAPGLEPNGAEAIAYYERAVALGENKAQRTMAAMLLDGRLVPADPPRAVELLEAALVGGDAQSGVELGNVYARGRLGKADYALASAAYDAAAASGSTVALARKAVAVLSGPLANAHGSAVLADLKQAAAANVPGASMDLARLMVTGKVPGAAPSDALPVLENAVSEVPAVRYLLALYRDGIRDRIPSQPARADQLLAASADLLGPDVARYERVLLNARQARLADLGQDFLALPPNTGPDAVRKLRSINQNAYVYAVQVWMVETGRYGGPVNGLLTASTIRAFNAVCAEAGRAAECRRGPLSSDAARAIGEFMFAQPVARTDA